MKAIREATLVLHLEREAPVQGRHQAALVRLRHLLEEEQADLQELVGAERAVRNAG